MEQDKLERVVKKVNEKLDIEEREVKALCLAIEQVSKGDVLNDEDKFVDSVLSNYNDEYLTFTCGRDKGIYAWYFDGRYESAVRISDLKCLTETEMEELL